MQATATTRKKVPQRRRYSGMHRATVQASEGCIGGTHAAKRPPRQGGRGGAQGGKAKEAPLRDTLIFALALAATLVLSSFVLYVAIAPARAALELP